MLIKTIMNAFELLCGLAAFLLLLYYYFTSTYDFWQKRGVKGPKPTLLTGNLGPILRGKQSFSEHSQKLYNEFESEKLIGIFGARTPILVVKDLDLIKNVLIKDFSVFADRGRKVHEKVCVLFFILILYIRTIKLLHYKSFMPFSVGTAVSTPVQFRTSAMAAFETPNIPCFHIWQNEGDVLFDVGVW